MTLRLVVATANPDKAREIVEVLSASGLDVELVPRPADVPEVVEDGETLLDNARLKARALRDATGCAAIADDIAARELERSGVLVLATEIPVGDVDEPMAVAAASALARGAAPRAPPHAPLRESS